MWKTRFISLFNCHYKIFPLSSLFKEVQIPALTQWEPWRFLRVGRGATVPSSTIPTHRSLASTFPTSMAKATSSEGQTTATQQRSNTTPSEATATPPPPAVVRLSTTMWSLLHPQTGRKIPASLIQTLAGAGAMRLKVSKYYSTMSTAQADHQPSV